MSKLVPKAFLGIKSKKQRLKENAKMLDTLTTLYGDAYTNMDSKNKKLLELQYKKNAKDIMDRQADNKKVSEAGKRIMNDFKKNNPLPQFEISKPKKEYTPTIEVGLLLTVDENGNPVTYITKDLYLDAVRRGTGSMTKLQENLVSQNFSKIAKDLEILKAIDENKKLRAKFENVLYLNPKLAKVYKKYGITDPETQHKLYLDYINDGSIGDFDAYILLVGKHKVNPDGLFNSEGLKEYATKVKLDYENSPEVIARNLAARKTAVLEFAKSNGIDIKSDKDFELWSLKLDRHNYLQTPEGLLEIYNRQKANIDLFGNLMAGVMAAPIAGYGIVSAPLAAGMAYAGSYLADDATLNLSDGKYLNWNDFMWNGVGLGNNTVADLNNIWSQTAMSMTNPGALVGGVVANPAKNMISNIPKARKSLFGHLPSDPAVAERYSRMYGVELEPVEKLPMRIDSRGPNDVVMTRGRPVGHMDPFSPNGMLDYTTPWANINGYLTRPTTVGNFRRSLGTPAEMWTQWLPKLNEVTLDVNDAISGAFGDNIINNNKKYYTK